MYDPAPVGWFIFMDVRQQFDFYKLLYCGLLTC